MRCSEVRFENSMPMPSSGSMTRTFPSVLMETSATRSSNSTRGSGGERGLGSQEASTETESHQRAADGRIVLLSRLQMQPFFQALMRCVGQCGKLNADTRTRILPGNHSGGFDHGPWCQGGQRESDKAAFLAGRAGKPDREPALAKPRDGGLLTLSILEPEICGDINFQPDGPAPLSFQESSGSSKTRLRLFGRDRLVDNKVRSQLEGSLKIGARVR